MSFAASSSTTSLAKTFEYPQNIMIDNLRRKMEAANARGQFSDKQMVTFDELVDGYNSHTTEIIALKHNLATAERMHNEKKQYIQLLQSEYGKEHTDNKHNKTKITQLVEKCMDLENEIRQINVELDRLRKEVNHHKKVESENSKLHSDFLTAMARFRDEQITSEEYHRGLGDMDEVNKGLMGENRSLLNKITDLGESMDELKKKHKEDMEEANKKIENLEKEAVEMTKSKDDQKKKAAEQLIEMVEKLRYFSKKAFVAENDVAVLQKVINDTHSAFVSKIRLIEENHRKEKDNIKILNDIEIIKLTNENRQLEKKYEESQKALDAMEEERKKLIARNEYHEELEEKSQRARKLLIAFYIIFFFALLLCPFLRNFFGL